MLLLVHKQLEEYYKITITCGKLLAKNHVYRKNIGKQEKTVVKLIKFGLKACGTTFFFFFSNKITIEAYSRKNRVMLRRTPHEKMHPDCSMYKSKQSSGSIGIWTCMNFEGVGCFKLFNRRLFSQRYLDILAISNP